MEGVTVGKTTLAGAGWSVALPLDQPAPLPVFRQIVR
jgi:hypothetical protein